MRSFFFAVCTLLFLTPQLEAQIVGAPETGYASYIASYLDGRKTAYGEIYNKNKLTAAHRTYPLGTLLKVTRPDNGKSITVRVNDKGPVDPSRVVDVSFAAAEVLDLVYDGLAMVQVQVVDENGRPIAPPRPTPTAYEAPAAFNRVEVPISYDYKPQFKQPETTTAKGGIPGSSIPPTNAPSASPYRQDLQPKTPVPAEQPSAYGATAGERIAAPPAGAYFVQLGAFSKRENAETLLNRLSAKGFNNAQIQSSDALFKTLVGPYNNADDAKQGQAQINQSLQLKGFVTRVE